MAVYAAFSGATARLCREGLLTVQGPFEVPSAGRVLVSKHASNWLKSSVAELITKDPVTAKQEAFWLYMIMKQRTQATDLELGQQIDRPF